VLLLYCAYCRLADWEVTDMLARVEEDLESAYNNPSLLAHELLHKAAFSGGLSNSLLPDPASLGSLNGEALRAFMAQAFVAGNIAVTGAGVSMAQLQAVSKAATGKCRKQCAVPRMRDACCVV
jgi:predicted Zn-dependent peptidase